MNRNTAYSLSCVTGWKITYTGSNGAWYKNGSATTATLTAYYGDKVDISTDSSNITVTIYIGTDTSRIRDGYARVFTPSTGYSVTGCTSLTAVTGRHTITASTAINKYTVKVQVSGTYLSNYNGTITVKNGSTTLWSKSMSGVTSTTTYDITNVSYGAALTTTVPNYTSGSITYSGSGGSITVTSDNQYIYVTINGRTCSTCNAATTCGSSSSCTGCSSTTTCGSSSRTSKCNVKCTNSAAEACYQCLTNIALS